MKKVLIAMAVLILILEGIVSALEMHFIELHHIDLEYGESTFIHSPLRLEVWAIKEIKKRYLEKKVIEEQLNLELVFCYNFFNKKMSLDSFKKWTREEWQRFEEAYREWNIVWPKYQNALLEFDKWQHTLYQAYPLAMPEMEEFDVQLNVIHSQNPYSGIRWIPWQEEMILDMGRKDE